MAKQSKKKAPAAASIADNYVLALAKLRATNLDLTTDVLTSLIHGFSTAEEFSIEEKRAALTRLLAAIVQCADNLESVALAKPQWANRDRSQKTSPHRFLEATYANELASGSLTKATIRRSDFSLYKALSNPHWTLPEGSENIFANLPSKKQADDTALRILTGKLTRKAVGALLPREFREMLRLLHVAEMRQHRLAKRK